MDYTILIGGEAGQGVQTIGEVLSSVFANAGYHVFSNQDYESRVRGGHNFYQIRVSAEPVMSLSEGLDIIVALDKESMTAHSSGLTESGVLIYDPDTIKPQSSDSRFVPLSFKGMAVSESGKALMANSVATGAVFGMIGSDAPLMGIFEDIIKKRFSKKGGDIVSGNIKAAQAGFKYAKENCTQCRFLPSPPQGASKILIDGQDAAAIGALASGLKFYSAYPMTPSTGIMNGIAKRAHELGIMVEQAEDEISAINMALGASFMGVRAATGSSGGGFALMVEGLSLSAMTETPIVIFEVMRPGPATGLPTRTEQGDLLYVAFAGHGEFLRIIFAPGSPKEIIYLTNKAFDLAEKYQIPVFVMFDQYLSDAQWTYDDIDPDSLVYNDYRLRAHSGPYSRHMLTDSGVSPMAVPGYTDDISVTDSDEHDEQGHIIEDAETRIRMVQKRLMKKFELIKKEISQPQIYGQENAGTVLVCWGSSFGVVKEAVDKLNSMGRESSMIYFSEVYPLPQGPYIEILKNTQTPVCVEGNATGQFAKLLRMHTGLEFKSLITRFDGRPLTADYIIRGLDG